MGTGRQAAWWCWLLAGLLLVACSSGAATPGPDGDTPDGDAETDGDIEGDDDGDEEGGSLPDGDLDPAEDGDTDDENEDEIVQPWPEQPDTRVVYELYGPTTRQAPTRYNRLPFPYDFFTTQDPTALSGRRLNFQVPTGLGIKVTNTNLIDFGLEPMDSARYINSLNTLDGFSSFGYLFVEVKPDVDATSLPQDPDASVTDGSTVWLLDVTEGPTFGARQPIYVERLEARNFVKDVPYDPDNPETYVLDFIYVGIRPVRPLLERHTYALVIRRGLRAPDGTPLEPSTNFLAVSGQIRIPDDLPAEQGSAELLFAERERLAPLMMALQEAPISLNLETLLLAVDFTVQSITHTMREIERRYEAGEQAPEANFDTDDDGEPNLYTDAQRHPTGEGGFPSFNVDLTHAGAYVHGTFKAIDWRMPDNATYKRAIDYDDQGNPLAQGTLDVPFWLFFPKDESKQPFPVLIAQHGIYDRKESVARLAPEYLEQGWAVLVMDFPYHGERATGFPPMDFIDVFHPLKARSSFIQSASEQVQLVRMLTGWQDDVYPEGGDDSQDLDPTRISYLGTSLGGIVGGVTLPVSRHLRGGVLNVAGGGLMDFVYDFLGQYGLLAVYPDHVFKQFSTFIQTFFDAGDCVNYANMLREPPQGWVEKSVLIQESIDDDTVPNVVSENLARALYLPHLEPVVRPVYDLTATVAPVMRAAFIQFDPATHSSIWGNPATNTTARRIRQQIQHFIETQYETGQAEIISPEP